MAATEAQVAAAEDATWKHQHDKARQVMGGWTCHCGEFVVDSAGLWAHINRAVADAVVAADPSNSDGEDANAEAHPLGRESWEYGVETRKAFNNFEPTIEWGASVGMSHRYEYTADSVHGLAGGNPVWRRKRTRYADVIGDPEPFLRPTFPVVAPSGTDPTNR